VGHKCPILAFKTLNLNVIGLLSIELGVSPHLEEVEEE